MTVTGRGALVLLAAGSAVLGACSGDATGAPAAVVVDSSGVRVVTHHLGDVAVSRYATVGESDLQIGVQAGPAEYTLSRVAGAVTLRDGRIIIADADSRDVRVFGADGAYERTIGERGDGPGEFANLSNIAGVSGDTLFLWDLRTRRVTAFSTEGALGAMKPFDPGASGRPLRVFRLADGSYIARSRWRNPARTPPTNLDLQIMRDSLVLTHLDSNGVEKDSIRVVGDREMIREVLLVDRAVAVRIESRALGHLVGIAIDGEEVISGWSEQFSIDWRRPDGSVRQIVRVQGRETPTTRAAVLQQRDARIASLPELTAEARRRIETSFNDFPPPDRMPAFSDIVADTDGNLWVAEYRPLRKDVSEWLVFEHDGMLLGSTMLPPGLLVQEIGADHVLGVVFDDFEVPYLRRYPLTRDVEGPRE
jgi:6-bladed beta-propeller protein